MFAYNFICQNCVKNLWPNLQKPSLPSKFPGYVPARLLLYYSHISDTDILITSRNMINILCNLSDVLVDFTR